MTRQDKIKSIIYRKRLKMCLPIPLEQLVYEIKGFEWTQYEQRKIKRILKRRFDIEIDFNS